MQGNASLEAAVQNMCDAMRSRGPDAVGYWQNSEADISLGHRRLSIIDLDERANQPMLSDDNRYVIVFNGEIYNFRELRKQLESEGEKFRTEGDTEVILKLFIRDGEKMLPKLRGMFAFAIWDQQTCSLFLARDPYGIKPLYVARSGDAWCFSPHVKALLASGAVSHAPNLVDCGASGFLGRLRARAGRRRASAKFGPRLQAFVFLGWNGRQQVVLAGVVCGDHLDDCAPCRCAIVQAGTASTLARVQWR